MNFMLTIEPYKEGITWYFDDQTVDVRHEPFIGDINDMIDLLVRDAKIPNPERGFKAIFSDRQFPGAMMVLRKTSPPDPFLDDLGGGFYKAYGLTGWLCPCLNKYFPNPPSTIYVRAEPLGRKRGILERIFDWMYRNSINLP